MIRTPAAPFRSMFLRLIVPGQPEARIRASLGTALLFAICDLTELEVLYSARSSADRARLKAALDAHYVWCPMPDGIYRRSRVIQEQLTAKGEHRSAGPVTLLVAAAAEEAGLTLLHYDRDFETIARTTGQPVRTIDLRQ
ncbi:PIN domain-containing protein [Streptomyces sp. WAC04114]|uniref:PIN domain-containing protein n=1 Tax=Streptomyces sp. WAC04114 TaxID=2867961 RepID=UPI001C8BAF3B|nr:PIN domain-containing protein [Streptomyces sp. WAC04114]